MHHLSVCLSHSSSVHSFFCLAVHPSIHPSVPSTIHLSFIPMYSSIFSSIHLSYIYSLPVIHTHLHSSVYRSIHPSTHPSLYPPIHSSVCSSLIYIHYTILHLYPSPNLLVLLSIHLTRISSILQIIHPIPLAIVPSIHPYYI